MPASPHGWTRTWTGSGAGAACPQAQLSVTQTSTPSSATLAGEDGAAPVAGTHLVGGLSARVLSGPIAGDWWINWTQPGPARGEPTVIVHACTQCPGAGAPTLADVLHFVDALTRP